MPRVDIFGTYHVDRPSKVKQELSEFSDGVEVFFSEEPRIDSGSSDRELLLYNPTFWFVGMLVDLFWGLPGFLLTRHFESIDVVITEQIAQERGVGIEPVDEDLAGWLSNISAPLTILSWLWFLVVVSVLVFALVLWPDSIPFFGISLSARFFAPLAVAMGFLPVVPFAYYTLSDRDREMAENIEEILTEGDEINKGCLVVGHQHIDGVIDQLEESSVRVGEIHKPKFFR